MRLTPTPRSLAEAILGLACLSLASCAGTEVEPYTGTAPRSETLYVIAGGWHTEIGLPVHSIADPLRTLPQASGGTAYVVFGWGQRDYYMAAHPGFGDLVAAALPGPAVMLVIPLTTPPAQTFGATNVLALHVSPEGEARLEQYLWADLKKDPSGMPRPIAAGPYPGSAFYASTGTYDMVHNCNTWTAEALRVTGLPVSADGVLFADQLVDRLRPLAEASPR